MKSLNIALIHYSCPPVVGGVEEIIRQQASLFHRYGHRVKVFVGKGAPFSEHCDVECHPLLGSGWFGGHALDSGSSTHSTPDPGPYVEKIHGFLRAVLQGYDAAIAHNVLTMPYNLPLTMGLRRIAEDKILPVISWNHDSPYFYTDYPPFLDSAPWDVLKRPSPHIHYVTISESRKIFFTRLYGKTEEMTVIPNGIDPIRFFRLDPMIVRFIQEQDLLGADFIMVQPSRLHPRKNIELTLRVTAALREMGFRVKTLITGAYDPHEPHTKTYYGRLRHLVDELRLEEDVFIMAEYTFRDGTRLPSDRIVIRDLYLIADILFLPSFQEGFGIPLLESGMIKLPVFCSDIPPFREIAGEDAWFFRRDAPPEKIAREILLCLRRLKPHRMFRKVIKQYAWDNIYRKHLLPYLETVTAG